MQTHASKDATPVASRSLAAFDVAKPLHDSGDRPFQPRALGSAEFKRVDVYCLISPKEDRVVHVVGPYALGFRLQLEFDPTVIAVTERPRRLVVGDRQIELSFWWRKRTGREHYALLVPDADTIPGTDGQRRPRQVERLRAAAHDAGIDLQFVQERDVKDRAARVELWFHLLGFVQSARQLRSGIVLRSEVLEAIARRDRCRVDQVVAELSRIPASHIHIVIAELLYLGALSTDAASRLCNNSLVWMDIR
jgi:hypothetical protein